MNILFTNIGRRTYMVEYALKLKREYSLNIFLSDTSDQTAGFWVSEDVTSFLTPKVFGNEQQYLEHLLRKCKEYHIDIIIPLMDFELSVLAEVKADFMRQGISIIVSDYNVIESCLDKEKNYQFCNDHNLPVPASCFSYPKFNFKFPIILKKIMGSGSVDQRIIYTAEELKLYFKKDFFAQEFIEGTEYGMDIFNDLESNFLHAAFREKLLMRAGETDKARSVYSDKLTQIARTISSKFKHIGNMDVDIIVDKDDNYFCIDFNPRFGGGYPLTHLLGFNYLKYLFDLVLGKKVAIPQRYPQNVIMVKGISVFSNREIV